MHICRSRDLHLLLLDSSVLDGKASPESTQELVVCLEKFMMVQFHRSKGRNQASGRRKKELEKTPARMAFVVL